METEKKVVQIKGRALELLPDAPPFKRERLQQLGVRGLHCGSGANLHRKWLNTDLMRFTDEAGHASSPQRLVRIDGDRYYIEHDHTKPLPIADGALDYAFAEHFIEHITLREALDWLREVRRMLRIGGVLRLSTPDLRRYVGGYMNPSNGFFKAHRKKLEEMGVKNVPDRPAWMLNQIFSFWGHKWLYDPTEVTTIAVAAGFNASDVVEVSYRKGQVPELCALDLEVRSDESFYIEIKR